MQGDCIEVMKTLESNSVDTVITDPPYGLEFMGKEWDAFTDNEAFQEWTRQWATEALRVVKPGAMMLCFGGTRTFHRIACGIEDAGWEIRDTMMWLSGSGFPKSHNTGKKLPEWDGWGTALKPAFEPIIVAMKPRDGTFVENALKWGVAGLNIDDGRVPTDDNVTINTWDNGAKPFGNGAGNPYSGREESRGRWPANIMHDGSEEALKGFPEQKSGAMKKPYEYTNSGYSLGAPAGETRQIHGSSSGSAARFFYCAKASKKERNAGLEGMAEGQTKGGGGLNNTPDDVCGKYGSIKAKQQNTHPTVKPLSLMVYLARLTSTPTGGVVLDPFMGSGTTGMACKKVGRDFIGIELDPHYYEIAEKRIASIVQVELL